MSAANPQDASLRALLTTGPETTPSQSGEAENPISDQREPVMTIGERKLIMKPLSAQQARERYLSIEEASAYLNVSVRFMRRVVADRRVRHYKVGKFVRFDPADLDGFVSVQEPATHTDVDLVGDVWSRGRRLA